MRQRTVAAFSALWLLVLAVGPLLATAIGTPTLGPLPDGVGPLIVVEQGSGRVVLIAPDGSIETLLDGLTEPRGVALSPDGETLAVAIAGDDLGEGAMALMTADRETTLIADALDFPEGVGFFDDETVVFTTFTNRLINIVGIDGTEPRSVEILSNPTGVTPVQRGPNRGMAVATWDGPAVLIDPLTDEVFPITPPLAGGGHLVFDPGLGLCVPEYEEDRVSCFPTAEGAEPAVFDGVRQPVAVAFVPEAGLLLVSGPEGISVVDVSTGERIAVIGPLSNPAGLVHLGGGGDDWLAGPGPGVTTTTAPTIASTTTSTTTTTAPIVPPATGSGEDGGTPLWPFLGGLIALALGAGWLLTRRGGSFAAYPDPCDEICRAAAAARQAAEEAARQAERAERAADDARAEAGDTENRQAEAEERAAKAKQAAEAAARAHQQAQQPPGHSGGYAASGGVEYTGADHDRVEAERQQIDDEVEAGTKSQQEAQAEKAELRDPDKWKELEEQEARDHADRAEAARQKAEQAKADQADADRAAEAAGDDAKSARQRAEDAGQRAAEARAQAEAAAADAAEKERACRECLGQAAVAAAGGPDSWITREGGVGGPCQEGEKKTVTRAETFFVLDESREIVIEDTSIRPERISEETRSGIRRVFGAVATALGVGTKVPGTGLKMAGRLALSYVGLVAKGASSILGALEETLEAAKQPGGMSDYFFVEVTIPRIKVTVTCTCTIECRHGVMTCTGCTVRESSEPGDSVERSEGTRAEVERFITSMQARAKAAKEAQASRAAAVEKCSC